MDKHNRSVDLIRHFSFRSLGNIVSNDMVGPIFFGDPVFVEIFDGISVVKSHERSSGSDKVGVEVFYDFRRDGVGEKEVDHFTNLRVSSDP